MFQTVLMTRERHLRRRLPEATLLVGSVAAAPARGVHGFT
jgi:hypothetical protein